MKVCLEQRPEFFAIAGGLLGQDYRHELGHKIITGMGRAGKPLMFAVLTDCVVGCRAELTVWARRDRGLCGRTFLAAIARTVFVEWQCKRLTAIVRPTNVASASAVLRAGFRYETHLSQWFGDEDGYVFVMRPADCRWLPKE